MVHAQSYDLSTTGAPIHSNPTPKIAFHVRTINMRVPNTRHLEIKVPGIDALDKHPCLSTLEFP
jgi:hypothetical protein